MTAAAWCDLVDERAHSDAELYPPESSLAPRQFSLSASDLALVRECGIELVRRGSIDLGEDLLLLAERLEPGDFRVHLGLAISHLQRIADASDGVKYRAVGVYLMERIGGTWMPVPGFPEDGQKCIEHLNKALQLSPDRMQESLIAFRAKCLDHPHCE